MSSRRLMINKMSFQIEEEQNIIVSCYEGRIGIEDLINQTAAILAAPEFKKSMNCLVDLTLAEPDMDIDFEKVNQYKEFIESIQETWGLCKWAIVAPDDLVFGLSRMYEMLSKNLSIQTRVFRSEQEAREWLGITEYPV